MSSVSIQKCSRYWYPEIGLCDNAFDDKECEVQKTATELGEMCKDCFFLVFLLVFIVEHWSPIYLMNLRQEIKYNMFGFLGS